MTWRIPKSIEIKYRAKINASRPLFAWLDFLLHPSDLRHEIDVKANWCDAEDNRWLPAINSAVNKFVAKRAANHRPVGFTSVEMLRVISHPVDTDEYSVAYNMGMALYEAFDQHAISDDM